MAALNARATALGVPLSVHLDLTYRCNERCEHCYLDHDDHGEMTYAEISSLLDELAGAGALFLTLSGGEALLRPDFVAIVERARALGFCVRLKTNAVLVTPDIAAMLRTLGIHEVQVSVYSHRDGVHDAITKVPGSLRRTLAGIGAMRSAGLRVVIANVLMRANVADYAGVRSLAAELGVKCTIDPTVTPAMDGDRSLLRLGIDQETLRSVFEDQELADPEEADCGAPLEDADDLGDALPCSAGHSACYVSPYGDVFPCVQFPLPTGNVRTQKFTDIWRGSAAMNEVRSIRVADLPTCSQCAHAGACTRCPGLAWLEGSMRGPSQLDCAKSFAKTGVPTAAMLAKTPVAVAPDAFIPIDRLRARTAGL